MKRKTFIEIISSLLILLFVYAAVSKLLDYPTFRVQLGRSPFIAGFSGILAWALPAFELIIALMLMFRRFRLAGLYASLFMMSLFTAYIYMMLHFSYYIPCSCGGVLSKMNWNQHLAFNVFFVVLSIAGIVAEARLYDPPVVEEKEPFVVFT